MEPDSPLLLSIHETKGWICFSKYQYMEFLNTIADSFGWAHICAHDVKKGILAAASAYDKLHPLAKKILGDHNQGEFNTTDHYCQTNPVHWPGNATQEVIMFHFNLFPKKFRIMLHMMYNLNLNKNYQFYYTG